ncbi:MAG TPA: M36 family metallopeptidase [Streptosporangiales bacterium]
MRIARTRRTVTSIAVSTAAVAASVALATPGAAAPSGLPAGLSLVRTTHSLLGTHQWYQQTYHGVPVVDGWYARHLDAGGRLTGVLDDRKPLGRSLSTAPRVTSRTAEAAAEKAVLRDSVSRTGGVEKNATKVPAADDASARLAVLPGASPRLVWQVVTRSDAGSARTLVDANSGAAVQVRPLSHAVTGTGRVFDPNPVVTLRDESLVDDENADQQVLAPAYKSVLLHNLDGSGTLSGKYAKVVKARGGLAKSSAERFLYDRSQGGFEQVMAYYQIDQAQEYIQKLGFTDVNNEPQKVLVNTYSGDNSFYDPSKDTITYGRGGVDDAEDAEVIWHEYGHAIQDAQVPDYGESEEAGATGEGFGDYWAVTMSIPVSHGFDPPCVADWDSTSYTSGVPHCLRRTDTAKTTDDMDGEVHDDGEIWSAALWDIHQVLGRDRANTLILESQFYDAPDTTFAAAARNVVTTANRLYGSAAADTCTRAFQQRKIL